MGAAVDGNGSLQSGRQTMRSSAKRRTRQVSRSRRAGTPAGSPGAPCRTIPARRDFASSKKRRPIGRQLTIKRDKIECTSAPRSPGAPGLHPPSLRVITAGRSPGAPGFLSPSSPGLPQPSQWVKRVNRAETQAELHAMRLGVPRSQPLGSESWVENPGAQGFSVWSPRCVLADARASKTGSEIRPGLSSPLD